MERKRDIISQKNKDDLSVSQGEQENKKYMEYFSAKRDHFCYLRITDSTVLLTLSPRLHSLIRFWKFVHTLVHFLVIKKF